MAARFNTPPGWPPAPEGWTPPPGWAPDPSWPPAPEGWQFWVEDAAAGSEPTAPTVPTAPAAQDTTVLPVQGQAPGQMPGSVPYAEYSHAGSTQDLYPQSGGDNKKNKLVWIIPVAVVAVLGLVFGGLAIAGVFKSDDKAEASSSPQEVASPPEGTEPSVEPSDGGEPAPSLDDPDASGTDDDFGGLDGLEGLDGFEGAEGFEGLEDLLAGNKSTDPATPGFCEDYLAMESSAGDTGSVEDMRAELERMETLTPPAEIADDWTSFVTFLREAVDMAANSDPSSTPEMEELLGDWYASSGGQEAFESLGRVGVFIATNCLN